MAGSASEREIRDYAAGRLRQMLPEARIIHELVVAGCRADLAAIEPERVTLVEIKSERDQLKRLAEQVRQFERAAHDVIVIAHERWFDTTPYQSGHARFVPSDALSAGASGAEVWAYPELDIRAMYQSWRLPHWTRTRPEPHAARLLELLWRDELAREASRHHIAVGARTNRITMMRDMAWNMSGKEIARAVCRQLRLRAFPEADAPIIERLAA